MIFSFKTVLSPSERKHIRRFIQKTSHHLPLVVTSLQTRNLTDTRMINRDLSGKKTDMDGGASTSSAGCPGWSCVLHRKT